MMKVTKTEALPPRPDIISSDSVRERFHAVDGLRSLAVLALVFYELAKAFPTLFHGGAASIATLQTVHAFDLFALLSGFALAYPAFTVARQDGKAAFEIGRYAIKRIVRVLPAYLVVVALTLFVPVIAHLAHFSQLAGPSGRFPDFHAVIAALGTTSDVPLGNDSIWAAGAIARCYVVLPLLLVLALRAPIALWLTAIAAATADLMLPGAHALGIGALAAFALGTIAADLRAQGNALQRFGPLVFIACAIAGYLGDSTFAHFAGSGAAGAPLAYVENPMWQLAFFGLVISAGAYGGFERALGGTLFAFLSSASFAIALACEPIVGFIVHATSPSLSAPIAAINAYLMGIAGGIALWAAVDRWFADGPARGLAAERLGRALTIALRPLRADRLILSVPARQAAGPADGDAAPANAGFYAPPPRPEATDVASVKRRIGSADDLAAEILATKHRLAERSAQLFADPEPEKPKPVYRKPGFHGPGFGPTVTQSNGANSENSRTEIQHRENPVAEPASTRAEVAQIEPERSESALIPPPEIPNTQTQREGLSPEGSAPARQPTIVVEPSETQPAEAAPIEFAPTEPAPRAEKVAHLPELPELEIANASLERQLPDAQRFIASLDTLATGDGRFDSAGARDFTDATLGELPISFDLPTAEPGSDGDPRETAVEPEENAESKTPEPPRRVNLTLRPDRPITVRLTPETPAGPGTNGTANSRPHDG